MLETEQLLGCLFAYVLGSIPTAVWVGKALSGIDVRDHGSGNAGATNTFRVLGVKAGIPVLIFDVFKGWFAVQMVHQFSHFQPGTAAFVNFQLALGISAVLGHVFPLFARFKGGKGIATLLGMMIAIHYQAALVSLVVFLAIFLSTRYVSLGSMISAVTFPFVVILIFRSEISSLIIFSILIAIMVLLTHQKNIGRLIRKEESRANLRLKRSRKDYESHND